MLFGPGDVPGACEQKQAPALEILHAAGVAGEVQGLGVDVFIVNPADERIRQGRAPHVHIVFVLQAVLQHLELQHAHHAHNHLFHAAAQLFENLDGALLGNLGGALDELLALHRILLAHQAEQLRGKGGNALKGDFLPRGAQCVANGEHARVEHADDVPGVGLLDDFPALGHQLLGLGKLHLPPALDVLHLHALLKLAAANADESNSVPVGLVHVGLDFKHKGGEVGVEGVHHALGRIPGQGRGGQL